MSDWRKILSWEVVEELPEFWSVSNEQDLGEWMWEGTTDTQPDLEDIPAPDGSGLLDIVKEHIMDDSGDLYDELWATMIAPSGRLYRLSFLSQEYMYTSGTLWARMYAKELKRRRR